jgi:hypothetical protein
MRNRATALALLALLLVPNKAMAQGPVSAGFSVGTLTMVIANKNGFVVITDSRKSSPRLMQCDGRQQFYCDNSQKLFRTTPHSAMMIAGFASAWVNSPLDLEVASVIRKQFDPTLWPNDDHADAVPSNAEGILTDALTDVAAILDPQTPSQALSLTATFVRFDADKAPVVEVKYFTERWKPLGPGSVMVPEYNVQGGSRKVTEFVYFAAGITCVADAIMGGHYLSTDPVIKNYYEKQGNKLLLDQMSVQDMQALAKAIMKETEKFTDLVGGADQFGVFPADNANAQWSLPSNLPSDAQLQPRTLRFEGIACTNAGNPPCGYAPVSFMFTRTQRYNELFKKFFLASQFLQIPIALDDNFFVGNTFDHATLRWRGGYVFMLRNTFKDCILQLPNGIELPRGSELEGKCSIERNDNVDIDGIVGARLQMLATPSMLGIPSIQP